MSCRPGSGDRPPPGLLFGFLPTGDPVAMRAIADILRMVGGAVATVVTLPFRAVARLFGGLSRGGRRV